MSLHAQLSQRELDWLRSLFSSFYSKAPLEPPKNVEQREWAFQPLGSQSYVRHKAFKTLEDLRRFLTSSPPAHVYYSSARFLFPEVPDMEQKGWLGSDIIFDIDADHVKECEGVEAKHVCLSCGLNFSASGAKKCPSCGSQSVVEAESVKPECMEAAAKAAGRLVKVLVKDFGFKEVAVYFSGNRGFHVHVENLSEEVARLGSDERREVVDYIKGVGLSLELALGLEGRRARATKLHIAPSPKDPGWRGRIGEQLYKAAGLDEAAGPFTLGDLERALGGRVELSKYAALAAIDIDEKVTVDVHRLVRLPGSLNGKTGLVVAKLDESELPGFQPTCALSPFKGEVEVVFVQAIKEARVYDHVVDGRRGERAELPQCVAVFLALRGLVKLARGRGQWKAQ